jgi:hypothetical protein
MTGKLIATLPKNSIENLRVSLDHYAGHNLCNLRVWFQLAGDWRPGKQGLAVRVEQLPQLIKALQEAAREAGV